MRGAFGVQVSTRSSREKAAAARLGIGWVLGIGWDLGPVLLVSCVDGRRGKAEREEARRVERMVGRDGASVKLAWCYRDGSAARVRQAVSTSMAADRITGDLYRAWPAALAFALFEAGGLPGVAPISKDERAAAIEREMNGNIR